MYATLPELEDLRRHGLRDESGTRYRDFRRSLEPRYARLYAQIALAWGVLIAIAFGLMLLDGRVLGPLLDLVLGTLVGGFAFGYGLAFLHLFIHEASHYGLARDRRWNDLLANVFLGSFLGIDVRTYRPIHWEHHKHLGTTRDTERSYFESLSARFLLESLTGIRVLRVLATRRKALDEGNATNVEREARGSSHQPWTAALLNLSLVGLCVLMGAYTLALAWCFGIAVFFPFFASVRQVLEHRSPAADPTQDYGERDHGAFNFLFGSGPLASTLGGAGFNRHLLHHFDPQVSCTRLADLESFLRRTEMASVLEAHETTYARRFLELLRSSAPARKER